MHQTKTNGVYKMATTIALTKITCLHTSGATSDEVYFTYSIDGGRAQRFPDHGNHQMKEGDTWDMILPLDFRESVLIQLYEEDTFPNEDDSLGEHTYLPNDPQPADITLSGDDNAQYVLHTEGAV